MPNTTSASSKSVPDAVYAGSVIVLFLLIAWILCLLGGYAVTDAFGLMARRSYQPHHNFMTYIFIKGLSLPCYLFLTIGVTAMTMRFLARTVEGVLKPFAEISLLAHARRVTVIAVVVLSVFQLTSLHGYWKDAQLIFGGKAGYTNTNIQKTKSIADALREAAGSQPYKASMVTDLDTRDGKGLLERHILAYFLYPVDINGIYRTEEDAWIAFQKEDAARYVPAGYTIVHQIDEQNLIAVKVR